MSQVLGSGSGGGGGSGIQTLNSIPPVAGNLNLNGQGGIVISTGGPGGVNVVYSPGTGLINFGFSPYAFTGDIIQILMVDSTAGAITILLPFFGFPTSGVFIIKDIAGTAATNNITLDGQGFNNIDGATTLVMNANYQSIGIFYGASGYWIASSFN